MPATPSSHDPIPELSFNILLALGDGARHGYAIIQDIQQRTGARSTVRSGTLYASLKTLHDEGLVEDAEAPEGVDGRRRYYRLTDAGRRAAGREAARLAALVRRAVELDLAPGLLDATGDA